MNKRFVKMILAFLCLFFLQSAKAQQNQEEKLDPVFRQLLAEQNQLDSCKPRPAKKKKRNSVAQAKNTAKPAKKYHCIIYTTASQTIKEKGIIINAIYPTFLTAEATLAQIRLLSTMEAVKYIAAPSFDQPQKR